MRTNPPPTRDPEFDSAVAPTPRLRPTEDVVRYYQRLVVNPFLAILAGCLSAAILQRMRGTTRVELLGASLVAGLAATLCLLQYHCIDCGATGMFLRWKRHACPRVLERWVAERRGWVGMFPDPSKQMIFWVVALALAATLGVASWWES